MYSTILSTVLDEDNIQHNTYGISYNGKEIKDISTQKDKIEKLSEICNKLSLSPIHINDVIDDFLVDFQI